MVLMAALPAYSVEMILKIFMLSIKIPTAVNIISSESQKPDRSVSEQKPKKTEEWRFREKNINGEQNLKSFPGNRRKPAEVCFRRKSSAIINIRTFKNFFQRKKNSFREFVFRKQQPMKFRDHRWTVL